MVNTDKEEREVHPKAKALLEDFSLENGRMMLPRDAFFRWKEEIVQVHEAHKKTLVLELIALGIRFQRLAPEGSQKAIEQILELASILHGNAKEATNMFEKSGVRLQRAKTLTGVREDLIPSSEPPPSNSSSLFSLMVNRDK